MSENNAMVVSNNNQIIKTVGDAERIAEAMALSGYFQDVKDARQAMVKVMAGQEMGVGPFSAMTGIHVIKGKPVMGGNLIASLIKNDPRYNYRVIKHDNTICEIQFYEDGVECGVSSFTMEDAKNAGLLGNDTWKKYARNMLFNRAISNGARWYTPGIFGGAPVYTPEELGADVDDEGNVIDIVPVEPVQIEAQSEAQEELSDGGVPAPEPQGEATASDKPEFVHPEMANDFWNIYITETGSREGGKEFLAQHEYNFEDAIAALR